MNSSPERNLDYLAAQAAQKLVKNARGKSRELDNEITKALGVLQENGVYACFLYLLAGKKENHAGMIESMIKLLQKLGFKQPPDNAHLKKYITENVTQDLPRLLLAKEALEQMLIYARYGAKARH